jgi:leucine dehydrogenase
MVTLVEISQDEIKKITPTPYEKVVKVTDEASGLVGFIAVHNSRMAHDKNKGLGVSLGGLRIYPYSEEAAKDSRGFSAEQLALEDALRLSAGMTYKSAAADDGLGGAKAVIIADPKKFPHGSEQRRNLMLAMAEALNEFAKRYPKQAYVTAEDVNTKPSDMEILRSKTDYVAGLPLDEFDGNPSPFTAFGVLAAMKEALGVETMQGKRIAISGVGNVGGELAKLLLDEGASVVIADKKQEAIDAVKNHGGDVTVASTDDIHKQEVDIYAPCAMGKALNSQTIREIKAKYIIGAANNQLEEQKHDIMLAKRGVLYPDKEKIYMPDYIVNAGGVIAVGMEVEYRKQGKTLTKEDIKQRVEKTIRANVRSVLDMVRDEGMTTNEAASALANRKLAGVKLAWENRADDRGIDTGRAHG